MLTHVVLFKFPARADAEEARARLLAMRGRVETLLEIEAGLDITGSERSYDLALITRFADQAGLDAYRVHPVHQAVVAFIRARSSAAVAVDYLGAPETGAAR